MTNTSLQNEIALHQHTIDQVIEVIKQSNSRLDTKTLKQAVFILDKTVNSIKLLQEQPKQQKPDPKHWYTVEETAKKLFNWKEEDLFNFMHRKGWIYKSGKNNYWLAKQPLINSKILRQKSVQIITGENYCKLEVSEYGEKELIKLREQEYND